MKLLSLLTFILLIGNVSAQKPCEKSSIYFDINQSDLSDQSRKTLNQLIKKFEGTEYLVELYGYADSTASAEYNLALSQKRIDSVKVFLNKVESINFNYFETNLGEEEDSGNKDLALSRRVDIYVLPVQDGKIVIRDGSADVSVPLDYFSPCGACQSQPGIDAYYTVEEARENNTEFMTTDGIELISAGSFDFNFTPCNEEKYESKKEEICYTIYSNEIDPDMLLWEADTIDGVIYWRELDIIPEIDTVNKTYTFCASCRYINLDKPIGVSLTLTHVFPEELKELRSELDFKSQKSITEKSKEDTMVVAWKRYAYLRSSGQIGNTFYHFKRKLSDFPITDTTWTQRSRNADSVPCSFVYRIELEEYEQLLFSESDTILLVKLKNNPVQVGYYLRDVHQFIPFEWDKKNKRFYGQKPTGEFELAYMKKRDRVYVLPKKKTELKYRRFRKIYKPKFQFKYEKKFKREKVYTQKKAEWDKVLEAK